MYTVPKVHKAKEASVELGFKHHLYFNDQEIISSRRQTFSRHTILVKINRVRFVHEKFLVFSFLPLFTSVCISVLLRISQ